MTNQQDNAVELDELINAPEAARYSGLTPARIYQLTNDGKLGKKLAGHWVYTRRELDERKARRKNGRPRKATTDTSLMEA